MLNKIAAACLLSLATLPALAADEFRAEYRLNMSEADFRKANEQFFDQGLRLVDITVSEVKGRPVVGAIWHRYQGMAAPSAARTKDQLARIFLRLDEAGLKATGQRLGAAGSMVEVIDAYSAGGKTWFAASFSPAQEPAMQTVGAFLNTEQFAEMRKQANEHDNDVARVDAYAEGGQMKSLPAFVGRGTAEIDAQVFENTLAILAQNAGNYLADLQPMAISVFASGANTQWLALWDKGPKRSFVLTDDGKEIAQKVAAGGMVMDIDSQPDDIGGVSYYAVVQDKR